MKMPGKCSSCNKLFLKTQNDLENICSECKIDESFHNYLQVLRRKKADYHFLIRHSFL